MNWSLDELQRKLETLEREATHRSTAHHDLVNKFMTHQIEALIRIEQLETELKTLRSNFNKVIAALLGIAASGLSALISVAKWGG